MKSVAFRRNNARIVGHGARTVVLAHGFGGDQTAWRAQEDALCREHRVVLFDHMGAGGSDLSAYSPRRYQSLHSYAADVLELLADLDDRTPVDFVGHSMSAMVGLLAAIAEPARFRSMVFLGGSPRYVNDEGYKGGFEQSDVDALHATMAAGYQAWASGFAGLAMGNPERPELATEFARTLAAIRPDIALAVSRIIYESDHRADLARLTVPTLVLQARNDLAVPLEVGEYLARHIPQARLVLIDATGHFAHMSAPAAVNDAILSFLR